MQIKKIITHQSLLNVNVNRKLWYLCEKKNLAFFGFSEYDKSDIIPYIYSPTFYITLFLV